MSLQLNTQIQQEFLRFMDPPHQFPPNIDSLLHDNDRYFLSECHKFLSNQRQTYELSHKIQKNLNNILQTNKQLQQNILKKDNNSEKIFNQLQKLQQNRLKIQQRQKNLSIISQLIKLQSMQKMLKLQKSSQSSTNDLMTKMKLKSSQSSISSDKNINEGQRVIYLISIQQKREYLQNILKIYNIIKDSSSLQQIIKQQKLPLIQQIINSLYELFYTGIQKALSSQLLTPDMCTLILTQYYQPFLTNHVTKNNKKTAYNMFTQTLISNRLQKYRLQLNPMINNLNYAANVIDLYDSILTKWVKIIQEQLELFNISGQTNIVKSATKLILNQAMPKLEKNIYKIKQMSEISFIRFRIYQFLNQLNHIQHKIKQSLSKNSINISSNKQINSKVNKQLNEQQKWQPLPMIIDRMKIFLATKIQQYGQKLSTNKYNIYSLTSYLPIRQYLQTIKQCIEYDFEYQNIIKNQQLDQVQEDLNNKQQIKQSKELSKQINQSIKQIKQSSKQFKYSSKQIKQKSSKKLLDTIILDWQQPFYKLFISRKPQSQANNKSLVIFNLNIWYLYLKTIKKKFQFIAVQTMLYCKQKFIQMNIKQCSKIYYDSLDKVLQLCGNIPQFRNTLYSQINLLGHEDLRTQIALGIKQKYLIVYQVMLKKIGKTSMTNEQVKIFCKDNKINLNKFGKNSNHICIYSLQQLTNLVDYN